MDLNTFQPAFLIQIEGQALSTDITGEITSFVFEDNEEELDVMEVSSPTAICTSSTTPCFRRATRS